MKTSVIFDVHAFKGVAQQPNIGDAAILEG